MTDRPLLMNAAARLRARLETGGIVAAPGAQDALTARLVAAAVAATRRCELTLSLQGVEAFSTIDDLEAARLSYQKLQQRNRIHALATAVLRLRHPHQRGETRRNAFCGSASGALLHQCDGAIGSIAPWDLRILVYPDPTLTRLLGERRRSGCCEQCHDCDSSVHCIPPSFNDRVP